MATILNEWNPNTSDIYGCCDGLERETLEHFCLKSEVVKKVWNFYSRDAGIIDQRLNLKQSVRLWINIEDNYITQTIYKVLPIVAPFFYWKR